MKKYKDFFTIQRWKKLSPQEQAQHSYIDCRQCLRYEEFSLKKFNNKFIDQHKSTPPAKTNRHQLNNEQTPPGLPRRQGKVNLSKNLYKELVVISTTRMSYRTFHKQRKILYGYYNPTRRNRNHIGNMKNYSFNRDLVISELERSADEKKNLGNMNGRWKQLADAANLRSKTGIKVGNPAQVRY